MKTPLLSILLLSLGSTLSAQTFSEWFRQNKTQKKYLLEQIAALEVYAGYLQKGYAIAKDGLNTINSIRHGDFELHDNHFQSFRKINPTIRNLGELTEIKSLQEQI